MPGSVGPLKEYILPDGTRAPFFVIKFDKEGKYTTLKTRDDLLEAICKNNYTDVLLFSHGWNNTPKNAITKYEEWIEGYIRFRTDNNFSLNRPYRPVLIGIVWPSVWFVNWWQQGPSIAAASDRNGGAEEDKDRAYEAMLLEIAEAIPEEKRERFYQLAESGGLSDAETREFLEISSAIFTQADDETMASDGPSIESMLTSWDDISRLSTSSSDEFEPEDFDTPVTLNTGTGAASPEAAGVVLRAPEDGIRTLSVWQMKDRAGTIGANGVARLLRSVIDNGQTTRAPPRTHLIGHSFGAKVMLSAICSPSQGDLAVPVNSLLLLQPAINQYAFASSIPDSFAAGGYHGALAKIEQPILTTFTKDDMPLRTVFHLALRRDEDLGEIDIASDVAPSRFAALGGYGPANVPSSKIIDIKDPGKDYQLITSSQLIALRAHNKISGHSEISNPYTYWALLSLVKAS